MDLSPEQKERIYLDEKAKRESRSRATLLLLLAGAAMGVAGYVAYRLKTRQKHVSIDDLRKAYSGLGPDDEE